MNKFYLAVTIGKNKKYYSYVLPVSENNNLLCDLKIKNIITANICKTKKYASWLVNHWNACYKANNEFLFDDSAF